MANKWFYLIAAAVVVGGVGWLVTAGGGGQSSAASLPVQFDSLYSVVEADPAVGLRLGAAEAPITIVEFADYQCPHCARFGSFTGRLLRQNYVENGTVNWVLYDYVLGTFPHSVSASLAARCAGDQGNYWGMHDLLLARQNEWGRSQSPAGVYGDLGEELGMDGGEIESCVNSGQHIDEVVKARKYGDQRQVTSTPTLFLNGRRLDLRTEGSYEALEALIRQASDSIAGAAAAGE